MAIADELNSSEMAEDAPTKLKSKLFSPTPRQFITQIKIKRKAQDFLPTLGTILEIVTPHN